MRYLIPFEASDLGVPEVLWLLLALGGLSLVAPARGRVRGALWVTGILLFLGVLRMALAGAPDDWMLPLVGIPLAGGSLVLLGMLGPHLARLAGPRPLAIAWVAALVLVSLALRPFGRRPIADLEEWAFLALLGVGLCAWLQGPGGVRRLLVRRVGPAPLYAWVGAAFLLLCGILEPFGVGWGAGATILIFAWLVYAVLSQGREMREYVRRRLIGTPIVLFLLLTASFFMVRTAPGGPFDKEKRPSPAVQAQIEEEYGFDEPLHVQYGRYMGRLILEGDLGSSFKQIGRKVTEIIGNHIGPSAQLGACALALALLIGITAGLVSGIRQNSIFDYASMAGAMIGLSLPTFVVGPLLVLVFAIHLDWFQVSGWGDWQDLVLPSITLALPFTARIARLTRAGMLEIVNQDYIRTARAKGLGERTIVVRHTLKGTLLPVVSFLGPAIAQLLTGSLVVETIFRVPGLGTEFVQSALNRDYGLVLGLVLLFGTLLIVMNLIVDVAYAFLDPRIRHA